MAQREGLHGRINVVWDRRVRRDMLLHVLDARKRLPPPCDRCRSAFFPNLFELLRRIPSRGRRLFARPLHSTGAPFGPPLRVGEPAIVIAHAELETAARTNLVGTAAGLGARRFLELRITADRALVIHPISTS